MKNDRLENKAKKVPKIINKTLEITKNVLFLS